MNRFLLSLLLFMPGFATAKLPLENAKQFTITSGADTVDIVRISAGAETVKPVLLWFSGSLPMPLIVVEDNKPFIVPLNNFDYRKLSEHYHIVLVSQPHTPVIADRAELTASYIWAPDPAEPWIFDENYLRDNHLGKYVKRGESVLGWLRNQAWADTANIVLTGHSQGSHVALHVASRNPGVRALGYFGGNILGRYTGLISDLRDMALRGVITPEEAQIRIDKLYTDWRKILRRETTSGDMAHTWRSFSQPEIDLIARLPIPVFIAYGTEDPGARSCDYLPVYFELEGKSDYRMAPFTGRGHNFEKIRPDGSHDYDDLEWQQAMDEFADWLDCLPPSVDK